MAAFDGSAFDASFDIGGGGAGGVDTGAATAGLSISVVSPLVFSSSSGSISWAPLVVVGAVDVSARLSGSLKISAAEDSARVATLTLIPASAADLDGYEGQAVTIDVTLFRTGQAATWRLFTGCVERSEFSLSERLVTLSCRDGWQERPAACASAAQVEALLGGLATTSGRLLPWSDAEPDPVAYFNGLLETIPVPDRVAQALVAREGPHAVPLALARALEGGTVHDIRECAEQAMFDMRSVNRALLHALAGATQLI